LAPFSYLRDARTLTPNLESHQHFKYIKFKRVIDFYRKLFDNIPVPKSISKKFAVFGKTVYLEGVCNLCAENY
jgi:Fe2+ or Zn2+ uptake regulation protein